MGCVVKGCTDTTGKKAVLCKKHWDMLPEGLRADVNKGTEKGQRTLRANPSREWFTAVAKICGDVKHLVVKVDAQTNKINRKLQAKPEEIPA